MLGPCAWIALALAPLQGSRPQDAPQATPRHVDLLNFGIGRYAVYDTPRRELTLEYRWGQLSWLPESLPGLGPQIGYMMADERGVNFTYAGLHYEVEIGAGLRFTPQIDVGHYHAGEGRKLGSDLQFRSSLELSYALSDELRLGWSLRHISNGGLAASNPGAESLLFGLQFAPGPNRAELRRAGWR